MVISAKRILTIVLLLALVFGGVFGVGWAVNSFYKANYPHKYSEIVEKYAAEFAVDPDIIYAIIKTESDFVSQATSDVGARGLMQIMEDTFDWIKGKLADADATYDDMYLPEQNIRYGAFLVSCLYEEFGSYKTAVAAYHAGRTATANWLKNPEYSKDGITLDRIPSDDTGHYVGKVMDCFETYKRIYGE